MVSKSCSGCDWEKTTLRTCCRECIRNPQIKDYYSPEPKPEDKVIKVHYIRKKGKPLPFDFDVEN